MLRNKWAVLALLILICLVVGTLGGLSSTTAIEDWYRTIAKPSWTPPDAVFGPVWTVLYIMMAVAAWLVWRTGDQVRPALILFFVQLALNLAWTLLFFAARSPGLASNVATGARRSCSAAAARRGRGRWRSRDSASR